jgi:hypothetical protein
MRCFVFLFVLTGIVLDRTVAQQPPKEDTPKPYSIPASAAQLPAGLPISCTHVREDGATGLLQGLFTRGGVTSGELVVGVLDMTADCISGQVEATVPNGQKVGIQLRTAAGDKCKGVPTFKADPKPDYASIFATFLKPLGTRDVVGNDVIDQRISLPPASKGTMTIAISCENTPNTKIRNAIIHYKNPPQFSASAGSLISLYGKHIYSVSTSQTGVASTGVATTENSITLETSKVQFVPIGFVNTYVSGTSRLHLDIQAGLGINPNGSKTQVEYFFGPALATHGIYFSPGLHIARASYLGGGFTLGEVIPSGVTPPVNYRATYKFAFAISYSPPVKSGS